MKTYFTTVIFLFVRTYISSIGDICTEEIVETIRVPMPEFKSHYLGETSKERVEAWEKLLEIKAQKAFRKEYKNSKCFHYELKKASSTSITLSKEWKDK